MASRRWKREGLLVNLKTRERFPFTEPRLDNCILPRFYIMVLKFIDRDRLMEVQSVHVDWIFEKEKEGILFLSGPAPCLEEGEPFMSGMMVIRAKSESEARAIAETEPLIVAKVMTYWLYQWNVVQGSIAVSVNLSDGTGNFV